jgi:hypothetical protein
MQDKKKKADIKINEVLALVLTYLKSKKDAKGGVKRQHEPWHPESPA